MRSGSRPFQPPFCPHRACRFHTNPRVWRYVRWGTYQRRCPRVPTVPRFRCSHCRRTFSRQTFQTTYWLRRTDLQATILDRKITAREVLRERLFPARIPLPDVWQTYYDREVPTRKVPNAVRHRLRYAY